MFKDVLYGLDAILKLYCCNFHVEWKGRRIMASELDSWCIVSINGINSIAKIKHIGRGKFRIIEVFNGNLKVDTIVDASDVSDCRVQIVE